MTIEISSALPATDELTRNLYHEGLHMLLFMDGLLPSQPSSHAASFAAYQRRFEAHPGARELLARLEVFIEPQLQQRAQRDAAHLAVEIRDHLIEEKYIFDQERAHLGTAFSNRSLALTYIVQGLQEVGVLGRPDDRDVRTMVDHAVQALDAVQARSP